MEKSKRTSASIAIYHMFDEPIGIFTRFAGFQMSTRFFRSWWIVGACEQSSNNTVKPIIKKQSAVLMGYKGKKWVENVVSDVSVADNGNRYVLTSDPRPHCPIHTTYPRWALPKWSHCLWSTRRRVVSPPNATQVHPQSWRGDVCPSAYAWGALDGILIRPTCGLFLPRLTPGRREHTGGGTQRGLRSSAAQSSGWLRGGKRD